MKKIAIGFSFSYIVLFTILFLTRTLSSLGFILSIAIFGSIAVILAFYELFIFINVSKIDSYLEKNDDIAQLLKKIYKITKFPKLKKYQDLINMNLINCWIVMGQFDLAESQLNNYPEKEIKDKLSLVEYYYDELLLKAIKGQVKELNNYIEFMHSKLDIFDDNIKMDLKIYQLLAILVSKSPIIEKADDLFDFLEAYTTNDMKILYNFMKYQYDLQTINHVNIESKQFVLDHGKNMIFAKMI